MNDEQIELLAEKRVDALDRVYLTTAMTEAEYKRGLADIEAEANAQRRRAAA
jgi:hypothetical protein